MAAPPASFTVGTAPPPTRTEVERPRRSTLKLRRSGASPSKTTPAARRKPAAPRSTADDDDNLVGVNNDDDWESPRDGKSASVDAELAAVFAALPPLNEATRPHAVRQVSLGPEADVVKPLRGTTVIDAFATMPERKPPEPAPPPSWPDYDDTPPPESVLYTALTAPRVQDLEFGDSFILHDPRLAAPYYGAWNGGEDDDASKKKKNKATKKKTKKTTTPEASSDVSVSATGVEESKGDGDASEESSEEEEELSEIERGLRQCELAQKDPALIDEFIRKCDREPAVQDWADLSEDDKHVKLGKEFVEGLKKEGNWPPEPPTQKELDDAMRAADRAAAMGVPSSSPTPADARDPPADAPADTAAGIAEDVWRELQKLGDQPLDAKRTYSQHDEAAARRVVAGDVAQSGDPYDDGDSTHNAASPQGTTKKLPDFYRKAADEIAEFAKAHLADLDDPPDDGDDA